MALSDHLGQSARQLFRRAIRRWRPKNRAGAAAAPTSVASLPADVPDLAKRTAGPLESVGVIAWDHQQVTHYPGAMTRTVDAISLRPKGGPAQMTLIVFEAKRVALSTCYLPIDLEKRFLFINQS